MFAIAPWKIHPKNFSEFQPLVKNFSHPQNYFIGNFCGTLNFNIYTWCQITSGDSTSMKIFQLTEISWTKEKLWLYLANMKLNELTIFRAYSNQNQSLSVKWRLSMYTLLLILSKWRKTKHFVRLTFVFNFELSNEMKRENLYFLVHLYESTFRSNPRTIWY